MAENRVQRCYLKKDIFNPNLLMHIFWCSHCKTRMVATYASKKNIKYRYYVCHTAADKGYAKCPTKSVNAQAMETAVFEKLLQIISNSPALRNKKLVVNSPAWEVLYPQERRRIVNRLIKAVEYNGATKKLSIEINGPGIEELEREIA